MSTALEIHGLSVACSESPDFHDVDLTIETGEAVALTSVGPADFHRLLEVLAGLRRPQEGKIDWTKHPALASLLTEGGSTRKRYRTMRGMRLMNAFLSDTVSLVANLSIYDNIALPLRYHYNAPEPLVEERANRLLDLLQISSVATERPAWLSLGMRRRAALARALILEPTILFMDSPLSSIDDVSAGVLVSAMQYFVRKLGLTIVVASYESRPLLSFVSRVVIFEDGRVVEQIGRDQLDEERLLRRVGEIQKRHRERVTEEERRRGDRRKGDRRKDTADSAESGPPAGELEAGAQSDPEDPS